MVDKDPKKRINIDDVDKEIQKINFAINYPEHDNDTNLKVCPVCTVKCEKNVNFCGTCRYKFENDVITDDKISKHFLIIF